jgi:hypothetical protein
MFEYPVSVRAAEWQSMKWLTEHSKRRATIVSISKSRKKFALLAGKMPANQAELCGRDRFNFT